MGLLEGQGRRRSAREGCHQDDAPPGGRKEPQTLRLLVKNPCKKRKSDSEGHEFGINVLKHSSAHVGTKI